MKKWGILCLAALIALPSTAVTSVYADEENPSSTTTSNTSNNETSSNNSTVTSNTYSTENSSTSTENSNTSSSTSNSGGGGTIVTNSTSSKPVISLIGDASIRMKVGTSFTDPGTTVQDDVYNDLSAKATYTLNNQPVNSIDTNTIGTYVIHYNVTTSDDRVADEVTRDVIIVAVGDYIDPSTISIKYLYGAAQHGDYVYVAQRETGLARVNLYSGKVETIVSSNQSFMAVALNSSGDLFYTIDSDRNIYKLSHNDLQSLPLSESDFNSKKTSYYYAADYNFIYGLAIDQQNNIYFSDYTSKGILKLPAGTTTPQVVLSNFDTYFTSFTMDSLGNLYMSGDNSKLYRIKANILGQLPIHSSDVSDINTNNYYNSYGMFFTPDGRFYINSNFSSFQLIKETSASVDVTLTLNGKSEMYVYQGDTFVDPGVSVSPSDVTPTVTYTLDGSPAPGIDSNVIGVYTIHYTVAATEQYEAKEIMRTVTVQAVPTELTKVQMNRPFGLAYHDGYVYYTDYDRGLYKVSTTTFKMSKIADSYQIVSLALNKEGDLFYSKVSDPTVYKLKYKYVRHSEELNMTAADLQELSQTYYTLPVDLSNDDVVGINGLAFDSQDRLYLNAVSQNKLKVTSSKIWRLPANSKDNAELVATYSIGTLGMTISPLGNLYVNVMGSNGFEVYEADASLLNNLPISVNQFKSLGETNNAYGIVFLPDLTGYTSSVQPMQNLTKLKFLDRDYSIPEVINVPITTINLNQNSITLKKNGSSQTLTATISPDNATHPELVWKSSNPSVVTVQNGVLKPVGKGTATIHVYAAAQPEIFSDINVTVKDDDKSSSASSSNDLKLGVDDGKGKNSVPSTANVARTVQSNGQMQDQITFDSTAMLQAINTLKSAAQQTVRLVVPDAADQVAQTDVTLPLNVSQDLKNTVMNLEISTNNVKLSVAPSSLNNINSDLYFHFIPLKTTAQQNAVANRAKQEQIVKDALGNGNISVVGRPMTIETNLQNQPVQLVMPVDNSAIPTNAADREQWLQQLRIFIEHSDGDRELVQPTVVSYGDNTTGLQFTVNKFSTFTIVDMDKLNASNSTTTSNTNSDNGTGGTVKPAYIQGYPDQTFRPDQGITRAEMASLLYRLQASGGTGTAGTVNYSDVSSSFWTKQAINAMQASGLMKGRTSTTFAPAQLITRAEMAAIVSRWQGLSGTGSSFASDINGNWAETDIKRVVTAGLMQGITPASFQPNQPLTRAQAVTILNKILEKTANLSAGTTSWKDVPSSHWAYSDIMEASNSYSLK
ncbi:S-layer homology domain-containing protein [Paenibacillus sp. WLX2291]|uniref:S-layer homology domain-containing protein n=1 Tax=Paenibacillus sp. WLX2291 TaxID=3296934 RepID=UPI003983E352